MAAESPLADAELAELLVAPLAMDPRSAESWVSSSSAQLYALDGDGLSIIHSFIFYYLKIVERIFEKQAVLFWKRSFQLETTGCSKW